MKKFGPTNNVARAIYLVIQKTNPPNDIIVP
jgi:hypothetical protein